MSPLERGFKSWTERLAAGIRRDLGLPGAAPLPPGQLAAYLDVTLWTPEDVPGLPDNVRAQLLVHDPWGWSAATLTSGARTVVIFNPRHSAGRRASNIAHELSHLLLDHEPSKIILSPDGSVVMRTFDVRQEDEAGWLSGTLLLPRTALLAAVHRGLTTGDIAQEFGVSEVLATYRLRMTGVSVQLDRTRSGNPARPVAKKRKEA